MKSVLMSIKPYFGFLIIAMAKGWDIEKYGLHKKTIEVRKNAPKDTGWNKKTELYFSKDKKSLSRIPEEYRKEVEALCGKVVAEFTCNKIEKFTVGSLRCDDIEKEACLTYEEMIEYFYKQEELDGDTAKLGYGLHISDLVIYDKPREFGEFKHWVNDKDYDGWNEKRTKIIKGFVLRPLTRPPQSWCYVEEI